MRYDVRHGASARDPWIAVFSETDQTEDPMAMHVLSAVRHGDNDEVMPIANSAAKAVEPVPDGTLTVYADLKYGVLTPHPDLVNAGPLASVESLPGLGLTSGRADMPCPSPIGQD